MATLPLSRPALRLPPVSGVAVTSSSWAPWPSFLRAAWPTSSATSLLWPASTVTVRVAIFTILPATLARALTSTRNARLSELRTLTTSRPSESTLMVG